LGYGLRIVLVDFSILFYFVVRLCSYGILFEFIIASICAACIVHPGIVRFRITRLCFIRSVFAGICPYIVCTVPLFVLAAVFGVFFIDFEFSFIVLLVFTVVISYFSAVIAACTFPVSSSIPRWAWCEQDSEPLSLV
jgi:hypothetical protein